MENKAYPKLLNIMIDKFETYYNNSLFDKNNFNKLINIILKNHDYEINEVKKNIDNLIKKEEKKVIKYIGELSFNEIISTIFDFKNMSDLHYLAYKLQKELKDDNVYFVTPLKEFLTDTIILQFFTNCLGLAQIKSGYDTGYFYKKFWQKNPKLNDYLLFLMFKDKIIKIISLFKQNQTPNLPYVSNIIVANLTF